jgi:hypothetical protein
MRVMAAIGPGRTCVNRFSKSESTSPAEARVGQDDMITLITFGIGSTARIATVLHFNGSSFEQVSSGTLP